MLIHTVFCQTIIFPSHRRTYWCNAPRRLKMSSLDLRNRAKTHESVTLLDDVDAGKKSRRHSFTSFPLSMIPVPVIQPNKKWLTISIAIYMLYRLERKAFRLHQDYGPYLPPLIYSHKTWDGNYLLEGKAKFASQIKVSTKQCQPSISESGNNKNHSQHRFGTLQQTLIQTPIT